jgi:hypothetical protein
LNVRLSVGRTGVCWDNAQQESFWSTLKTGFYHRYTFDTRIEAIAAVSRWIETVYNRNRRHSALGYIDPVSFEHNMINQAVTLNTGRWPEGHVGAIVLIGHADDDRDQGRQPQQQHQQTRPKSRYRVLGACAHIVRAWIPPSAPEPHSILLLRDLAGNLVADVTGPLLDGAARCGGAGAHRYALVSRRHDGVMPFEHRGDDCPGEELLIVIGAWGLLVTHHCPSVEAW